ncbi:GAP family protein [Winogradskyella jejuensis]|uniref:Sap, sulfolipid-1-addressing protein n=1 Tax=Winogradskyella jejuensis TaxID=1089305 RepID=A0A1M5PE55_9FLAO|nr:GAP family protein [Winogradskyella jejuensis]SHH00041.1 Sap, sulfolipid-1-addressing protein [Winogradskyella jejuensis]
MADITILPLALTVMLGPQILVGMLLITRKDPIKSSLTYIVSLISTLILTTYIFYWLTSVTDFHKITISNRPVIKYLLIALLIFLIVRSIVNRNQITEPPKWMQGITTASLGKIFLIGLGLIAFMPTDIAIAFTVGNFLNDNSNHFLEALPFFVAVVFISFIPLLIYFLIGKKGHKYLENVNDWLNTHGYIINIIVLSFFIFLLL